MVIACWPAIAITEDYLYRLHAAGQHAEHVNKAYWI